ncbi:MAG: hypothetical protein WAM84_10470, partial [Candidatus Cybelea sp.]
MKLSHMGRLVTLMTTVTLAFTGCGGAGTTSAAPLGAIGPLEGNGSRMLPGAKQGDLMYVAGLSGKSYVLSYPQGKLVGTIDVSAAGACSDSSGDVFLPVQDTVLEYTHGATVPSATLNLPYNGYSCAVDPVTGNLAVTLSSNRSVAVFPDASGTPTTYQVDLTDYFCGYDSQGNLFVDGWTQSTLLGLSELPKGASEFTDVAISPYSTYAPGQVQWDGQYVTVQVGAGQHKPQAFAIYRLAISDYVATIAGTTRIKGIKHIMAASWLDGDTVIVPYGIQGIRIPNIGFWRYPQGGRPAREIKNVAGKFANFSAVTISV